MATLAVCMIVRNEEETLSRALESVRAVADEIVVVDTGSTDATPQVAASHGARVVHARWERDFSRARNRSLAEATAEWILVLDADEIFVAGQEARLRDCLGSTADAFFVTIESDAPTAAGGPMYRHRFQRLFRRLPGLRFEGRVHEQIGPALVRIGARVGESDLVLRHLGYAVDDARARNKLLRNLELLEADQRERPADPLIRFHLGETCVLLDRPGEALVHYAQALASGKLPPEHLQATRLGMASAHLKLRDWERALVEVRVVLDADDPPPVAWLLAASASLRAGDPQAALTCIDHALEMPANPDAAAIQLGYALDRRKARLLRSEAWVRMGDTRAAWEEAQRLRDEAPDWVPGLEQFARLAQARGQPGAAVSALRQALDSQRREPRLVLALTQALVHDGRPGEAREVLRDHPYLNEDPDLTCLAANLALAVGDVDAARRDYERTLRLDPGRDAVRARLEALLTTTGPRTPPASQAGSGGR